MQLHNLLTSSKEKPKPEGIIKSSSTDATATVNNKARRLTKKNNSANIGGDSLVKEIQAMIISQEIKTKNQRKLAKIGGQHAYRFLSDPKFNEHKTIDEKFLKKGYESLAVQLYKNKLQNNPIRNEVKL